MMSTIREQGESECGSFSFACFITIVSLANFILGKVVFMLCGLRFGILDWSAVEQSLGGTRGESDVGWRQCVSSRNCGVDGLRLEQKNNQG